MMFMLCHYNVDGKGDDYLFSFPTSTLLPYWN